MFSDRYTWILYVICAGLAWGVYVPLIFFGGNELGKGQSPLGGRLMAILCVGVAYFVLAVMIPLGLFMAGQAPSPKMSSLSSVGLIFSGLAGVAGAVGAICVIFATRAAMGAAKEEGLADPFTYKMYIAPLIFGLAPIINTLVSSVWHPEKETQFYVDFPGWKLWLGIVLVGLGAALVLFSKEEAEKPKGKAEHKVGVPAVASAGQTTLDANGAIHAPGTIGEHRP